MRSLIAALLLTLLALPASAEKVYKWVDENGVSHFSAQPPPEQSAETVDVRPAPGNSRVGMPQSLREKRERKEERAREAEAAEELARAKRERDRKLCQQARDNYEQLKNENRVRVMDEETGRYRVLPYEELVAKRKGYRQDMEKYCRD